MQIYYIFLSLPPVDLRGYEGRVPVSRPRQRTLLCCSLLEFLERNAVRERQPVERQPVEAVTVQSGEGLLFNPIAPKGEFD